MSLQTSAIDFVAYDKRGEVVLLAEARGRTGTSGEWAAQFRANFLSHGVLPHSRCFLIAAKDRIYFWKQLARDEAEALPPDFSVETQEALAPYIAKLGRPVPDIGREGFDFLVLAWLDDLAKASAAVSEHPRPRWLVESGFLESIKNARIDYQPQ